jgi:cyclopropane fatty-acyl-phospholipid synthase-like methyltransferase
MAKEKSLRHRLFVLQRITLSRIYRLLGSLNIHLQPIKNFCIKEGYHHAFHAESFDDRQNKDEWQRAVYESALSLFKKKDGKTIIDLGCGSGYKLIEMFGNYSTTGIELTTTYNWLIKNYPSRKWLAVENTVPAQLEADMIVCSDVIEHIKNPDEIMDFLKCINFRYLVISTPERNSVRGIKDFGPPQNTSHFREWNAEEFKNYISKWFFVQEQIISSDKSPSQILICTNSE